jgi:hypothetical protein
LFPMDLFPLLFVAVPPFLVLLVPLVFRGTLDVPILLLLRVTAIIYNTER